MDNIILTGCLFIFVAIFAIAAFVVVSALVWLGGWYLVAGAIFVTVLLSVIASTLIETRL